MEQAPSGRSSRIADRMSAARQSRFVGRQEELALFRSGLLAEDPPFALVYIFGPGGVGKTTLLREYARIASILGRPVVHVDGRNIDPAPSGFLDALRLAMDPQPPPAPDIHPKLPPRCVLLIDTFELLTPVDTWLRETFLPQLPAQCMIVIVGRNPPAAGWNIDIDWADLTRVVMLGNLTPDESQTYLAARGIPAGLHADALVASRGHPLALALIADSLHRGDRQSAVEAIGAPDVMRVLLERFIHSIPSVEHRRALEVCVLARTTTEELLADLLGGEKAYDLFEWLRSLSFIEQGRYGIFPHDLARDVLVADFRWRNADGNQRLGKQIHEALHRQIVRAARSEHERLQLDALYAIRSNPTNEPYFDWNAANDIYAEPASAADAGAIVEMVRAHEGDASAAIAAHWFESQQDAFLVFRHQGSDVFGFMTHLALHCATSADTAVDPAVLPALRFVEQHGAVAGAEEVLYLRYWMHCVQYQAVTAAINLTASNIILRCTTHPTVAWNFIAMADPVFWKPHFDSVNFARVPEIDFEVGGRRYGVFAHDWRAEPPEQWLQRKMQPMPFAMPAAKDRPVAAAAPMSRSAFDASVHQALRDYTRPERLAENPRLRSTLLASDPTPAALRALLREATATLQTNPRDIKFHRAIQHTYIMPAPTQEAAAELLDLPFNTYRYHLARGIKRISQCLWHWNEYGRHS